MKRRQFLQHATGLTLAAQTGALLAAEEPPPRPWMSGSDLVAKMTWLNPPAAVTYGGGIVTARSRAKTDFWRKTFFGYVTDNGHFYFVPVFGEFSFQARVSGKYAALYDQAGEPKEITWTQTEHLRSKKKELVADIVRQIEAYLDSSM